MKPKHRLLILISCLGLTSWTAAQTTASPKVNVQRIMQRLKAMAEFGKNPEGGVSRVAYTDADRQGREYAIGIMREAGLAVHVDPAGNIVGSLPGADPALKPVYIGSHIDSVPKGGNYDGVVGSLAAIEVAQVLNENGIKLRHPLEVVLFQNEEGGTVGSHILSAGADDKLLNLKSQSGKTIREGIEFIGGDINKLSDPDWRPKNIAGYCELHIEQGAILEQEKINIGVVEGIVGILHSEVTVEGFANHAGTTLMNQRHDALLAAARFIQKVNEVVTGMPGRQVGTVGWIRAEPGAYNVIPGKAVLGLELRDLNETRINEMFNRVRAESTAIGNLNGTRFSFTEPVIVNPALTDKSFQQLIDASAKQLGLSTKFMPSGAGHDAQEMARLGPVGMIFIPSVGGISHSPKEFSRPEDIENGANVLLRTILNFDRQRAP